MNKEEIQAIRTKKCLDDQLLKCKGVIGVDVEYKRVKGKKTDTFTITAFVKKKLAKEELSANEAIPEKIEGIPTDVVECPEIWPSPETSRQMAEPVDGKKVKTMVLVGGLSISNQYNLGSYGTLGIVLESHGRAAALSSAHVMVYPPPQLAQGVIEPSGPQGGTYPADRLGVVSYAEYGQNNVDAAFASIVGRFFTKGSILNIGRVNDWGIGFEGTQVKKMGATTGLTFGTIGSTTFTWSTTDPNLGPITLYNQIRIDGQFALPGDSGAALIDTNNLMVGMVQGGCCGAWYFTVCNTSGDLRNALPQQLEFQGE